MAKINYIIGDRTFILIRDRIGTILLDELQNQYAMTYDEVLNAGIYVEKSRPVQPNETPLVNVSIPEGNYDNQTVIKADGTYTFEVDCYFSQGAEDNISGDIASRINATKLMSACMGIIENPVYLTLDFDGPFILSMNVTNFQIGTVDREDATSLAVGTFNVVVKAVQQEPVGVGLLIAGSNTIANIEGGPQRLIYEGDATPPPPPTAPGSTVFNTDGEILGVGASGGSFIVADSTYIITDEVGNVLHTGSIPATDEFIQVITSSTVTNTLGTVLATILAQGTNQLADVNNIDSDGLTVPTPAGVAFTCTPQIVCSDATAVLKNTVPTTLSTTPIASGASADITAPDATATLNGGAFLSIPSGATQDIELVNQLDVAIVPDSVVGNKITVTNTMFWELNYNDTDELIFIVTTASNIGTFTSGSGTNVGTITVSTDDITYVALTFPFVPVVATTYYFKRSTFAVTGNYQITGTYA